MHLKTFCSSVFLRKPISKTNLDLYKFKKSKPIFLILNLTILLLIATTHGYSMDFPQITIREQNAPLEKVFKEIEKQSGYIFLYDKAILHQTKAVSIKATNA